MTIQNKTPGLCAATILALGVFSSATSCTAPAPTQCRSAQGAFGAVFELTSESVSPCADYTGDTIGMRPYTAAGGGDLNLPAFKELSLGVRAARVGNWLNRAAEMGVVPTVEEDVAVGDFTTSDPEGDFCSVPSLNSVHVAIPVVPPSPDDPKTKDEDESVPEQPAVDVNYEWSDIRLLVSAAYQGTQFNATLTYTDNIAGCSAEFNVKGIYPAVDCESDDDCVPEAGVHPDFQVRCEVSVGLCVPDGDIPALN